MTVKRIIVSGLAFLIIFTIQVQGIYAEPSSNPISHGPISIVGNDDFTSVNGVVGGNGTRKDPYIIQGWKIDASGGRGVWVENATEHFVIRNCLVENARGGWPGIYLENVSNGRVENCTLENNPSGIVIEDSLNIEVVNNDVISNRGFGIFLQIRGNAVLENNLVKRNGIDGVFVGGSLENTSLLVRNNSILKNEKTGVHLHAHRNAIIANNNISFNNGGISMTFSSSNTITNNTIYSNENGGIFLSGMSNKNLIENNTIRSNYGYGVYISTYSENNWIYHNRFVNNQTQAYDNGSNYWDNGYPSGGNYWSDYKREDKNDDGIGDIPYPIPGDNNKDHYPLISSSFDYKRTRNESLLWLIAGVAVLIAAVSTILILAKRGER